MLSRLILFIALTASVSLADPRLEVERLFRQASSGEIRFTKLVQPSKDSLSAMKETAAKYLVSRLNTTDAREALTLVDVYRGIGKVATPYLIQALNTNNKFQLRTVCRCFGDIKDSNAVDAIFKVTTNSDYTVRSEALTAIGKSGGTGTSQRLLPFLNDSIAVVRKSCVFGLGNLKDTSSILYLVVALSDPSFAVRLTAYDALLKFDSLAVRAIASQLQTASNHQTVSLSIRLLGQLKAKSEAGLFEPYLTDPDPLLRGWSIWSFGRIAGKSGRARLTSMLASEKDLFVKSLLQETLTYVDTLTTNE